MPDRLLRDQGILNSLKENGLIKKTLLLQIGKFENESSGSNNESQKIFSSESELINIENIPFIGAGINFDRISKHRKNDVNVVWVRLGRLS